MKTAHEWATWREESPRLPVGPGERVSGYGVMGVSFDSGHVLGLRRWTASSVGAPFTSIWHRDPAGVWTFHETVACDIACSRWFGRGTRGSELGGIDVTWTGPGSMRVASADGAIDWSITLGSSPLTRMMSAIGGRMPDRLWTSPPVLKAMSAAATAMLGAGRVDLTGRTANGQRFAANPLRIWWVTDSEATVNGKSVGVPAALPEQASVGDFLIPQRGIFAIGQVFVTPDAQYR